MLASYNIRMFSTNSDRKAQIVERLNRTIKMRMDKLLTLKISLDK